MSYYLDIWDEYGVRQVNEIVSKSACTGGTCSVEVTLAGVVGEHTVWIAATDGSSFSDWASSTFTMVLGEPAISTPSGTITLTDNFELTFTAVPGAAYYVIDLYRPSSGLERLLPNAVDICTGSTCTLSLASSGETGTFDVWIIAGVGTQFGTWVGKNFTVTFGGSLGPVTLSSPTGSIPLADTIDLVFNMPNDAKYASLNLYYPGDLQAQRLVERSSCAAGVCTVTIPSFGRTGEYSIWISVGDERLEFGEWAESTFTVTAADMAAAEVDALGSAVESLPQLDTSTVEAAGEGPGN